MTINSPNNLTKRQIGNQRANDARNLSRVMNRLTMSILGEPAIETCECGKEHEVFPNQPPDLKPNIVKACQVFLQKVYPDISAEDLSSATSQPLTRLEVIGEVVKMLSDEMILKDLVTLRGDDAMQIANRILNLNIAVIGVAERGQEAIN